MRPKFGRLTETRTTGAETLGDADSGAGDQLVEAVLLDFQVERALGDPELFGHKGQIAMTRKDGCSDRLDLDRFQIHNHGGRGGSARLILRFVER